jgi:RNA-directed DNA polymerase
MAVFRWIADLIFGPAKRDVSQLEGSDLELIDEKVDLKERPLKPGHTRLTIRDRRLVPKRKASGFNPLSKRKKHFSSDQAGRLFSRTLRTRDRKIRDLRSDVEQLARYGLPQWHDEEDLAQALALSVKQLQHYSIHRHRDKIRHYVTFAMPKRSGGTRQIMAPKRRLKAIQRILLRELLDRLPAPKHAHGFVKGRSIKTGAEVHVGKAVVVKLDLADFFPSVTFRRVRGWLIALGYSYPLATTLAVLMTECERQRVRLRDQLYFVPVGPRHCVQGAPTSPAVCNAIAQRMDHRLNGLAGKLGFAYTRYADDLTFSSESAEMVAKLVHYVHKIVQTEGFQINVKKTRILRKGGAQKVTGVTVNETLGLSRKERRRIRAELHQLKVQEGKPEVSRVHAVKGKIAYLAMLNPAQAEALVRVYPQLWE